MITSTYLDLAPPVAVAHRGGAGGAENSLAAFHRAVDAGYTHVETDVHATADGVLVALHDATLDRVTDASGEVSRLPWTQVAQARIDGTEPVPRLTQLLDELPDVRISIDPKSDAAVEPLVRILRDRGDAHRVCIGSFDDARLKRVREALPGIATAAGPRELRRLRLAASGLLPRRLVRPAYVVASVPEVHDGRTVVDLAFVRLCHDLGVDVHVWTVNAELDMHRMLNLGVDGIITDELDALSGVLAQRGLARA